MKDTKKMTDTLLEVLKKGIKKQFEAATVTLQLIIKVKNVQKTYRKLEILINTISDPKLSILLLISTIPMSIVEKLVICEIIP